MTFTEIFEAIAEATGIEYSHFSVLGRIWDLADYYGVERRGKLVSQVLRELPQLVNRSPESNLISDLLNLTMRYSKYLSLTGAYSQESTSGAQKFDVSMAIDRDDTKHTLTDTGLTVTGLWYVEYYVDVTPNTDMYLSYAKTGSGSNRVAIFNEEGTSDENKIVDFSTTGGTFNTGDNNQVRILFYSGFGTSKTTTYNDVMLCEGTSAKPYEPYTGGAPSPNPDYAQEMQAVEISELKSSGRNMFDYQSIVDEATDAGFSTSAVLEEKEGRNCLKIYTGEVNFRKLQFLKGRFKENTQYKFYMTGYYEGTGSGLFFQIRYTDESQDHIAFWQSNSFSNIEILSASGKTVDYIFFSFGNINTGWLDLDSSYIVELSQDTGEFPGRFVGDTVTLSEPLILRALPNGVCDTYEDGVITRRVGVVEFDGSADEAWTKNTSSDYAYQITLKGMKPANSSNGDDLLCDSFIATTNLTSLTDGRFRRGGAEGLPVLVFRYDGLTTDDLNAWRTWLKSNPITVWYQLATPTTEALDIDLEWYGMENFWTDSELDPNMTWKGVSTGVD